MIRMTDLVVLRVFFGPDGRGGNLLGVVRDGAAVPGSEARQKLAAKLGYSETVFIDDEARGEVDIYTALRRPPACRHRVAAEGGPAPAGGRGSAHLGGR
jgi:predicted PhzF superfamily epimerase YddE/YHI9